jgi:transcriptional regulator with XRE-family HTH domain
MAEQKVQLRISELRKKRGYTQQEFADLLAKSVDTISNYERGKTGVEAILLVVKMCEVLDCDARDLVAKIVSVPNRSQNLDDVDVTLRYWWQRVFPEAAPLGGKAIGEIIKNLKTCVENISDQEIAFIFAPDDDLDKRFQYLVSDFESNLSRQYDMTNFSGEVIRDEPDICAYIFSYLKTRENRFLSNLSNNIRLRKFVRESAVSGSPSYVAQAMALSDFLN